MSLQSIETADLKHLLEHVDEYLGEDADSDFVAFGQFLAPRLASMIEPQELVLACELAFCELQEGYDQVKQTSVSSRLDGITDKQASRLRGHMVLLVDEALPPPFAKAFAALYERLMARLQQINASGDPVPELN